MKQIGIAIIGAGMIGAAHAASYRAHLPLFSSEDQEFVLHTVCDNRLEAAQTLAQRYGFQHAQTDINTVLNDPAVHVVSVTLPNFEHARVTKAALAAGKHVLCEKPLALSAAEAKEVADFASQSDQCSGTVFNNRRVPAIACIKNLITNGEIGELVHLHVQYQSEYAADPNLPYSWRYTRSMAGGGALHDIGAHAIDIARFLAGEIEEVIGAMSTTSIKKRFEPKQASSGHDHVELSDTARDVDTDDVTSCILKFKNGCQGVFSTSRVAIGMGNSLSFMISGRKGSIRYHSQRPGEYEIAYLDSHPQTFSTIYNHPTLPYISQLTPVPHDGVGIGFAETFSFMIAEFMESIAEHKPFTNGSIADGARVAEILEAIQISSEQRKSVRLS
jgi:predicted dehydrogenase